MSAAESHSSRRWFPSRLFLPHENWKTVWFGHVEIGLMILGPMVPMTLLFLAVCLAAVTWIFRTGWKLKT